MVFSVAALICRFLGVNVIPLLKCLFLCGKRGKLARKKKEWVIPVGKSCVSRIGATEINDAGEQQGSWIPGVT